MRLFCSLSTEMTKTITLVSFLRDCYTYMNINGSERCCKTNHSYFWGGPAALIETLENNYKIEIDHYISVDFKSFPKLIDSLGGVNVPIEPYEADYINRTTTKIAKISSGDSVKLSGNQALVYSRIRHRFDNRGRCRQNRETAHGHYGSYQERAERLRGSAQ